MSLSNYPDLPYDNGEQYIPAGTNSNVRVGLDGKTYIQSFPGTADINVTRSHSVITAEQLEQLIAFYVGNVGYWFYITDAKGKSYLGFFLSALEYQHINGPWWSCFSKMVFRDESKNSIEVV